jgi:hypothetical protein
MRTLLIASLISLATLASAASFHDVQKAVADDSMLASAGVEPSKAEMRLPCSAAVLDGEDGAHSFNCVYVQTDRDLNLFSLEDGALMSELQLTLTNMDGVALAHMGRYSQVQVFSGDRVAALYIHDKDWIDTKQTEAVYQWLLEHGVRPHEPRPWLGR